jgi:hypothetical protein
LGVNGELELCGVIVVYREREERLGWRVLLIFAEVRVREMGLVCM